MDVAFKTTDDELFASLVAEKMVEQIKPILVGMVEQAVKDYFPPRALTETEAKKLIMATGYDKNTGDSLAEATLRKIPSYPCGTKRRYWSNAIDYYLTHHNIA